MFENFQYRMLGMWGGTNTQDQGPQNGPTVKILIIFNIEAIILTGLDEENIIITMNNVGFLLSWPLAGLVDCKDLDKSRSEMEVRCPSVGSRSTSRLRTQSPRPSSSLTPVLILKLHVTLTVRSSFTLPLRLALTPALRSLLLHTSVPPPLAQTHQLLFIHPDTLSLTLKVTIAITRTPTFS